MNAQPAVPDAAICEALSRWRTATAIYLGTPVDNDEDYDGPWSARVADADRIEREIAAIPIETAEGLAIKTYIVLRDLLGEDANNPLAIRLEGAGQSGATMLPLLLNDLLKLSPFLNAVVGSPIVGGVA